MTDTAYHQSPTVYRDAHAGTEYGRDNGGFPGYVKPAWFQKDVHTAFLYMVGAAWTKGTSIPKSVSEWPMKRYPSGARHL